MQYPSSWRVLKSLTVVGIIPHIQMVSPNTRIIFRSHIEMRADLIRDHPEGPQAGHGSKKDQRESSLVDPVFFSASYGALSSTRISTACSSR